MSSTDNNNKDHGSTEDIFEIMERYNAARKKENAENNAPLEINQVVKPEPEKKTASENGQSKPSPRPASKKRRRRSGNPIGDFAVRLKAAFGISSKKAVRSKNAAEANVNNTEASDNTPKPLEHSAEAVKHEPVKAEAKINDTALKNHFSDNADIIPEDRFATTSTAINLSAHLAETAPVSVDADGERQADSPLEARHEGTGSKVKAVFLWIWNALTNMSFLVKAALYISVVLIISAYLSYYAITIANDVFAFVKTDREITVNIPENATDKEVAYLLSKNGLISYDWMFELYLIYKTDGDEPTKYIAGEQTLNATMNYSQLISKLTTVQVANEQVSVTIPEGYTVDQIIDLLVSNGIGTREGYVEAINSYPYKHEFVVQLDTNGYPETRKYRLEGYLYPDTYFFYKNSDEYIVINKMLNNFQDKFWSHLDVFADDIKKLGLTPDEIVTLASMIQSEAKLFIDFEAVSYVFNNRLSHSGTFPYLQSDATIQYILDEHVDDFTQEQLDIDNPYNTYKYIGLPPGAICNPGYDALSAAIYPDAPVDSNGNTINAYYFVSNKAGKTYYAETRAQHDLNKQTVKKDNEEYDKQNA